MATQNTESGIKVRRGDLIMVELKMSYTTSSYERVESIQYRLMRVTNLYRDGRIKRVASASYDGAYTQDFDKLLYRTGVYFLLPQSDWDVERAAALSAEHVYPNSTTPRDFQSLADARAWLAPARQGYVAPVEEPEEVVADIEEAAPAVETPAPVEARETTITVAGVKRLVRTEVGGKIRTVKQLEAAHTKAVKAAVVEMRRANLAGFKRTVTELEGRPWTPRKDIDLKAAQSIARRAERGTLTSWGTYDVATARKPFPKVRYTDEVPEYLVEIEPGHFATQDAAEMLRSDPATSTVQPVEESAAPDGAAFLASLLGNIAA